MSVSGLLEVRRPLAVEHDLALVDLDGVMYRGAGAVPGAADGLAGARDLGLTAVFVTNNASREPEEVAAHLVDLAVPATATEVLTAAQAAAALLAERLPSGAKVLVVGGPGLFTAVRAAGFTVVASADEQPDAVVQGYHADVSWRQLAEAAFAVQRGAWHLATNLDATLPLERGLAPGNGSLVGVVRAATGVEPDSAGKPGPAMFRLAAQRWGASRPLVIGDRLDTDLRGANAAGMPGLHVLTGVSSARDTVLAVPEERPQFVGADLGCLLHPHPAARRSGEWWVCGDHRAMVDTHGALVLESAPSTGNEDPGRSTDGLDVVRAACAAAWNAADSGRGVDPGTVPELGPAAHGNPVH